MHQNRRWLHSGTVVFSALGAVVLLGTLASCAPKSPEKKTEALRALYSAEVTSIVVNQDPVLEGGETGEPGAEPPEGEGGAAPPAPPVEVVEVILDVLISTQSTEKLPGVTLDLTQADAAGEEKHHRRVWVDTSQLERGPGTQVPLVFDDISYQAGDGFYVEVRSPIPPEERGEYREFDPGPS